MADQPLTGVLLVGGASRRFGSPKAYARVGEETLAERTWRVLGEVCDERIAVGKAGELELPFPVLDDGTGVRAPIAGLVAGLRAASHELVVAVPVDVPRIQAADLRALAAACREAALPPRSPLPGAYRRRDVLPLLERRLAAGELGILDALSGRDVAVVELDPLHVADADTPDELAAVQRGEIG